MSRLDEALQQKQGMPLLGVALYFYDPVFLEMAAHLGFDVVWIEMEHGFIEFAQAADLCRMAGGTRLLTMIRIPDSRRESVLKAAECGPDIIDLPMVNSSQTARELVEHGRYAPQGRRGFFKSTRAVRYALLDDIKSEQERVNRELSMMIQVETKEAVDQVEELCAVPGIDAILLGLGDLSTSLGVTGRTDHPRVREAAARALEVAKRSGKRVAVVPGAGDFGLWIQKGADILFCANDITCLEIGARTILERVRTAAQAVLEKSS